MQIEINFARKPEFLLQASWIKIKLPNFATFPLACIVSMFSGAQCLALSRKVFFG